MTPPKKQSELPAKVEESLPVAQEPTPMMIIADAVQKGDISIEVMERLYALQERVQKREDEKAFNRAFTVFQSELPIINKDKTVDYGRGEKRVNYNHASMGNIVKIVTPLLGKNGLAYRFERHDMDVEGGFKVGIMGILTHIDGPSVTAIQYGPIDKSGNKAELHGIASTTSYLERYVMLMLLGIATADQDDDGQAGVHSTASTGGRKAPQFDREALFDTMEKLFTNPGDLIKHRMGVEDSSKLTAPQLVELEAFVKAYVGFQDEIKACETDGLGGMADYYMDMHGLDDCETGDSKVIWKVVYSMYYRRKIASAEAKLDTTLYASVYNPFLGSREMKNLDTMDNETLKLLMVELAEAAKAAK